MAQKIPPARDPIYRSGDKGRQIVKSVDLDLFSDAVAEILEAVKTNLERGGSALMHGSVLAGLTDRMGGEDALIVWNTERDDRVCEDCGALDGTEMTMGEFLDTKFTTRCDGNCRCWPVKAE